MILGYYLITYQRKFKIETTFKFQCEKIQYTNSNVFLFILKNIFIDHGDVKTPARWFYEQINVNV